MRSKSVGTAEGGEVSPGIDRSYAFKVQPKLIAAIVAAPIQKYCPQCAHCGQ
jgi:hypothetical protein